MIKIAQSVTDLIGNTPIIKLNNIDKNLDGNIYAKCEFMNPTSSVKDRIAANMIQKYIQNGIINKNTHIIEPTSGNTGIALASICASLKLKLTLTMPQSMSIERRQLIQAFGANIILTPKLLGMQGSIDKANELKQKDNNSIILQQFSNPNNPNVHEAKTAPEILKDMNKKIDIFISGVGTGGTLSGIGKILQKEIPNIKIIAVEPKQSPVISGGVANTHKIQGIGAGFIPSNLDTSVYHQIMQIDETQAINQAKQLALQEGLLVGISSGANIKAAIIEASKKENKNKNIVTILCDTGERYISTELFNK
ncbi:Cysteine synthase [hydrothermal vent metagenome]|uniref:Cysteine synthase n=1 Tax=hydrothermal vent metagenome TaxID=652676 RepID=A0A3B1DRX2_9ZZZZ